MGETSMIPPSGTQASGEGATTRIQVQHGQEPVSSEYVSADEGMFPVRVKSTSAQILVHVDVEVLRRQKEVQDANEALWRRLHG